MGFILLQIASLLTATVIFSPGGLFVGFFSGLSYSVSGALMTTKNIYLNKSLNYNIEQVKEIISDLISNESHLFSNFFRKNSDLITMSEDLKKLMTKEKINSNTLQHGQKGLTTLIEYIEDKISKADSNTLKKLYDLSTPLLEHICLAISNIISLLIQYDSGSIGFSLKILICDSYPDKIDNLIKHLLKLLPNIILDILIDQDAIINFIEKQSSNSLNFLNRCPESIFELLNKYFPKVNWNPLLESLNMLSIKLFLNTISENLIDINKIFFNNLKMIGIFLPLILVFSTIRYQFLKIAPSDEKDLNLEIGNNEVDKLHSKKLIEKIVQQEIQKKIAILI